MRKQDIFLDFHPSFNQPIHPIQLMNMRNISCKNSSNLISYILHSAQYQPISSCKGIRVKSEAMLGGKIFDKRLHLTKIVPWDPGKQVMLNLKLETTMKPIHPSGTINVHRGSQSLFCKSFLKVFRLFGAHSKVRQSDLKMEKESDYMGNCDKAKNMPCRREMRQNIPKPNPET